MKFSHLGLSIGFVLSVLLSSCGSLSSGPNTNYGRIIASGESDNENSFTQSAYTGNTAPTYGRITRRNAP